MKKTLHYQKDGRTVDREVNYIPVRFILAIPIRKLVIILLTVPIITNSCYALPVNNTM